MKGLDTKGTLGLNNVCPRTVIGSETKFQDVEIALRQGIP